MFTNQKKVGLNRQIFQLTLPNIISNLSVPMLGMVDTILMGHIEGVYYLGAIAIAGVIFNLLYWAFGFLRMGTTGLTAQAYGKGDSQETILILARAVMVVIVASLGIILFQGPIAQLSFYLIDGSPEVEFHARNYFLIRIWAAPATLGLYAFHGWFLGMQNAKYPLYLAVGANIFNVIFNLIFVIGLNMNSEGVAWGTVLAQYMGIALAIFLFWRKYSSYRKFLDWKAVLEMGALKKFVLLNRDIFIRTMCLISVFSYFTAKSASFGDVLLAVNSILLQLWSIMAYGVDGVAFATESLVGKFIGEKNRENLKLVIRYAIFWAFVIGVGVSIAYTFFYREILFIFTDKLEIIEAAMPYFGWMIAGPIISGVCYIWDGAYIGATDSGPMRNSMLICSLLIFFPCFFLLREYLGNHSLWAALSIFMVFRGITLSIYAYWRVPTWIPEGKKTICQTSIAMV